MGASRASRPWKAGLIGLALTGCTSAASGAGSGPCFDEPPHDPDATPQVSCEEGRYELVGVDTLDGSGLATWPGRLELATDVYDRCLAAAEAYVGAALPELGLDVWFHHPDEAGWAAGDRAVACAVVDLEGTATDGAGGQP